MQRLHYRSVLRITILYSVLAKHVIHNDIVLCTYIIFITLFYFCIASGPRDTPLTQSRAVLYFIFYNFTYIAVLATVIIYLFVFFFIYCYYFVMIVSYYYSTYPCIYTNLVYYVLYIYSSSSITLCWCVSKTRTSNII